VAKAINESALLVNGYEHRMLDGVSYLLIEIRHLLRRLDVSPEEDDAARLHFAEQLARGPINTRAGQPDEQEPSGLLPDRK
jgi:hypothetical protein